MKACFSWNFPSPIPIPTSFKNHLFYRKLFVCTAIAQNPRIKLVVNNDSITVYFFFNCVCHRITVYTVNATRTRMAPNSCSKTQKQANTTHLDVQKISHLGTPCAVLIAIGYGRYREWRLFLAQLFALRKNGPWEIIHLIPSRKKRHIWISKLNAVIQKKNQNRNINSVVVEDRFICRHVGSKFIPTATIVDKTMVKK